MASAMSSAASGSTPDRNRRVSWRTSSRTWLCSSVATYPGSTTATRTCRRVTSWRSDSLKATTPTLVAAYTPLPLRATRPASELTLTRSATRRGPPCRPEEVRQGGIGGGEHPHQVHVHQL